MWTWGNSEACHCIECWQEACFSAEWRRNCTELECISIDCWPWVSVLPFGVPLFFHGRKIKSNFPRPIAYQFWKLLYCEEKTVSKLFVPARSSFTLCQKIWVSKLACGLNWRRIYGSLIPVSVGCLCIKPSCLFILHNFLRKGRFWEMNGHLYKHSRATVQLRRHCPLRSKHN